ncbi:MAG TPA: glycosyltransferase family 4 protein [Microlunatus sp.]
MTELLRPGDPALETRSGALRVGLVCPYSLTTPGGVQSHVLGLAGYLSSIGDRVQILAPGELDPVRARQYGISPEQFTSVGPALPVPYNGSVARITFGPIVAGRVRRWLDSHRLDLLHIHEPLSPSASMLSLISAAVPVVATFHTATPRSRLMRIAGGCLRTAVDKIEAGIAVSESARQVVVDHLGRHPEVIPNGIRSADFGQPDQDQLRWIADHPAADQEFAAGVGIDVDHGTGIGRRRGAWRGGDHPRLVFLGRLDEPRKGLEVLLQALPMIKQLHPDLDVVIAGRGKLSRIERRLPAGCVAVGEVDDATRSALLRSADLFVAPHVSRESFGIVLIEAISAGASVVASDLPAFSDLLTDGDDRLGFIFPAGDAAALAACVDRALTADRRRLNARALASVERFDWSRVGPSIRQVYARLLPV